MTAFETAINELVGAHPAVWTFSKPLGIHTWTVELQQLLRAPEQPKRVVVLVAPDSIRVDAFTERQSFTSWWTESLQVLLQSLHDVGYGNTLIQLETQDVTVLRTRKRPDRITVLRKTASRTNWESLTSDRVPVRAMSESLRSTVLSAFGMLTASGTVTTHFVDKARQVDRLVGRTRSLESITNHPKNQPLYIVDAGCGKAYLSIALTATLQHEGYDVHLLGIDANQHVVSEAQRVADSLSLANTVFKRSNIADIDTVPCTLLIALHACDTASDEALALGIRNHAEAMLVAPCCHKNIQRQLSASTVPAAVIPFLRHGIVKERLGDLLTDTLRVLMLEDIGYTASLEEFVSLKHTLKNMLIVAQRRSGTRPRSQSARTLQEEWGVSHSLVDYCS
jgi:Methyltransferase domain